MRQSARFLLLSCVVAGLAAAQEVVAEGERGPLVAEAIRRWAAEFEAGRLGPRGTLHMGNGLQPDYVDPARRAGFVTDTDYERITHLDLLQKLLFFAESNPSTELGDAVLGIAAARLESSFLDLAALQLREVGHWSLMRMEHQGVWFLVLRAAAGERVPLLRAGKEDDGGDGPLAVGPGRRVAALRLLGMKGKPVFRSTIEGAVRDGDARVRLAAAEALDYQRRPDSLRVVLDAVQMERHPVVSQALVRLVQTLLRTQSDKLTHEQRGLALAVSLQQFGTAGWRTDMDLLGLIEAFPHKQAIPTLLRALELAQAPPDALVAAVNKRASPMLRDRAGALLRGMTGALIAVDDIAGWRAFWEREKDRLVVPEVLPKDRPQTTRAQFFGVPVTGNAIGFVVDTSGSMDAAVAGTAAGDDDPRVMSRLKAAKEQIVAAVQAMDPLSTYSLWTFADNARLWTPTPQKPTAASARSLTELLSRLRAHGGTNLCDGLAKALQLDELRYGEQDATRIDELFVLSDGEPTAGEIRDVDGLLQVVREANKYAKVRIHAIYTGTGGGSDLLRRLAEENGGVFVQR